jgi:hypothetical protein
MVFFAFAMYIISQRQYTPRMNQVMRRDDSPLGEGMKTHHFFHNAISDAPIPSVVSESAFRMTSACGGCHSSAGDRIRESGPGFSPTSHVITQIPPKNRG